MKLKKKKQTLDLERPLKFKDSSLTLKDIDEKEGIVSGYFSTKNVRDSVGDIVVDGAFDNTIKLWGPKGANRIKVLRDHMTSQLVGRPLELSEDSLGLYHVSKIPKTSLGKDTLLLLIDKVITEQSFGYDIIKAEFNESGDYLLQELRVWEGSFVVWGANQYTPIIDVKKLAKDVKSNQELILERFATITKSLKSGTWETEEIPHMLELSLKMLEPLVKELEDLPKEEEPKEEGESITVTTEQEPKEEEEEETVTDETLQNGSVDNVIANIENLAGLLPALQTKEGRVLSARNRNRIEEALKTLQSILEDIDKQEDDEKSESLTSDTHLEVLFQQALAKGLEPLDDAVISQTVAYEFEKQLEDFSKSLLDKN